MKIISNPKILSLLFPFTLAMGTANAQVTLTVDTTTQKTISPYVYGNNDHNYFSGSGMTFQRQGGNRFTGYNWETNASNAGSDWQHSSDGYLSNSDVPGIVVTDFVDAGNSRSQKSIVTLQMAGYVAADKNGAVSVAEAAPSSRWIPVHAAKGSAFVTTPDLTDSAVYMDEFVNFLVSKYGTAAQGGVQGYLLDNEPYLWNGTHPRIVPTAATYASVLAKSIPLAKAVKAVDPSAEVYGGVLFGWSAYSDAWSDLSGTWFFDKFLQDMKTESESVGKRLLDVIDIHWYPEAQGETDCRILMSTNCNQTSDLQSEARIQAPRSLWDTTYTETSWIATWMTQGPIKLIPRLNEKIAANYPGTKFSVTEWDFGATEHWSGGLAVADVLGVYGKFGVYAATYWGTLDAYGQAGFKIYGNYDGSGSRFGDIALGATSSDNGLVSIHAAKQSSDPKVLHLIAINKSSTAETATFNLQNVGINLNTGAVWGYDSGSSNITQRTAVSSIVSNTFAYSLPARSVLHFVLEGDAVTNNQLSQNPGKAFVLNGDDLQFTAEKAGLYTIQVFDNQGRLLRQKAFNANSAETVQLTGWSQKGTLLKVTSSALAKPIVFAQ